MPYDMRLPTPFNMVVAGSTKSGKTTFVSKVLTYAFEMLDEMPAYVILFYVQSQEAYGPLIERNLVDEMISLEETPVHYDELKQKVLPYKDKGGSLIIFDDGMKSGRLRADFSDIFTILGHHTHCSLIFITQNLFNKNPVYRNMSLNFDFFVIMKTRRDLQQVHHLARQMCPGNSKYVIDAYNDATKDAYDFLMIDSSAPGQDLFRIRAKIFNVSNIHDVTDPIEPFTIYMSIR